MKIGINKKEEHAALPADLLRDIARLKGSATPEKGMQVSASTLYPVSSAIAAEELRKEEVRRKILEEAMPGQEIPGHGVFIGTWQPEGLSQKFCIFAAKEDLTNEAGKKEVYNYDDTVKRIAELKGWHGFDGTNYANDKEFYKALKNGSYKGGWIIPPREFLTGTAADGPSGVRKGTAVQPDNIYDHKDRGALRGGFCKEDRDSSLSSWYWSSTAESPVIASLPRVWSLNFIRGAEHAGRKVFGRQSCRPVRLEPVP